MSDAPVPVTRDEAINALARHLHWTMERFDPSDDERDSEWESLTETQRDYYRACVRELLLERALVRLVLT